MIKLSSIPHTVAWLLITKLEKLPNCITAQALVKICRDVSVQKIVVHYAIQLYMSFY